ncbi:hypothetical protein FB45DRAFT_1062655 [Roridomyces roridus]|uniref:Uncharacterized protein n=1 Tax=Roridomyces roridus TaxID=1738132 RepID=A0AAD7BGF6_9AGAR|nr:hypothetical protein FB45DRAFT_1062655 [Roridomyces roridus]
MKLTTAIPVLCTIATFLPVGAAPVHKQPSPGTTAILTQGISSTTLLPAPTSTDVFEPISLSNSTENADAADFETSPTRRGPSGCVIA